MFIIVSSAAASVGSVFWGGQAGKGLVHFQCWKLECFRAQLVTVNVNIHLAVSEQEGVEEKMQNTNSRFFF